MPSDKCNPLYILYNRSTLSCAIIEWESDSPTCTAGEGSPTAHNSLPSHAVSRSAAVPLNIGIADVIHLVHKDEPADSDILVLGTKELIPSPQVFPTN